MKNNDVLSNDERLENACELESASNQIEIVLLLLENLEYSRKSNDPIPLNHQLRNGLLDSLRNNLTDIKKAIEKVSDTICPDDLEVAK